MDKTMGSDIPAGMNKKEIFVVPGHLIDAAYLLRDNWMSHGGMSIEGKEVTELARKQEVLYFRGGEGHKIKAQDTLPFKKDGYILCLSDTCIIGQGEKNGYITCRVSDIRMIEEDLDRTKKQLREIKNQLAKMSFNHIIRP
jgi:hypothetical protein